MENTETGLVKSSGAKLPKFVEQAYDSIEGMKQFANMLLESKLVPDSYYEKGADNKPDYNKGKTSAVVIVLLQAQQLAVPPMTGLQHIVPVNGLLSIKGDLAKTMIFASGKLKKDSWKETTTGTIENEDMVVTIIATREDNGITTTRSFSVDKAKRMGLWITSAQANGTDGWKFKKSAWYKTPDRMIFYRCLGNLARDLFSDVLLNMYTTEEAVDINNDVTEVIETEGGAKITIPDKEHSKGRSEKMTSRVADKIKTSGFGEVKKDDIQDAVVVNEDPKNMPEEYTERNKVAVEDRQGYEPDKKEASPFIAERGSTEFFDGKEVKRDEAKNIITETKEEVIPGALTLKQMEDMDTKELLKIINDDTDLMEAVEIIGGKNTNKKIREIIFAHQNGNLAAHVAPYIKESEERQKAFEASQAAGAVSTESLVNTETGEIAVNKAFDQQKSTDAFLSKEPLPKKEPEKKEAGNKYGIEIPPIGPQGNRDFSETKKLFNLLAGVTPSINAQRYLELASKLGYAEKYKDKEVFCRAASVEELNKLLDAN
jgi:hypothetical protein